MSSRRGRFLAGKDARTLARDALALTQDEFSVAFKGSPMKRVKLRGLKRTAAVVLGNAGDASDVNVLERALEDPEPLARSHSAWALGRIGSPSAITASRERLDRELDSSVGAGLRSALESTRAGAD